MDKQKVREAVNRLVEAEYDRHQAQRQLEQFTQSNSEPTPPGEFENLQAFADFYEVRRRYQEELQSLRFKLDKAKKEYTDADHALRRMLPANVPLYYDYVGQREELVDVRFAIMHRTNERGGADITISASGPGASR